MSEMSSILSSWGLYEKVMSILNLLGISSFMSESDTRFYNAMQNV